MESQTFDIAIIGSGFGGASAAYTFSKAGLKTILIERGQKAVRDEKDWNSKTILIDGRYKGNIPLSIKQYQSPALSTYFNEVVG